MHRPYLQASKREALADYSLPVAVITLSFVGSYLFQDVTGTRSVLNKRCQKFASGTHFTDVVLFSCARTAGRAFIALVERFRYDDKNVFAVAPLERLSFLAILGAMGLGFSLSLLFFMDQNITSAMVNNPCNKYVAIFFFLFLERFGSPNLVAWGSAAPCYHDAVDSG